MQIAITSDTHDNISRINQLLDFLNCKKINILIHCGDISTLQTLKHINDNFSGKIYLSLGNVDKMHNLDKKSITPKNIIAFDSFGELEIVGTKIAFTHFPEVAKKLSKENKYDFIFYGHTHSPWQEKNMINPGTLSGMFNKSTFAVLDLETKSLELKIL